MGSAPADGCGHGERRHRGRVAPPSPPRPEASRATAAKAERPRHEPHVDQAGAAEAAPPRTERTGEARSRAPSRATCSATRKGPRPFDMADLAPGDDWYVAVNGVPVGPIRVAEVRRKAALGAVTEESLVWQEGLDEWRPLKTFPDLAANVREAAASGRISITPAPGRREA